MKSMHSRKFISGFLFLVAGLYNPFPAFAQVEYPNSSTAEQLLENAAEREDAEQENDSELMQLLQFKKHPLNMNKAGEDDLQSLLILSALHIEHFLRYRQLFGSLISIYELQAIPLWDINLIEQLLPYITIEDNKNIFVGAREMLKGGDTHFLFRSAQIPERSKGYKVTGDSSSRYLGGREKLYLRYRYNYKNSLQYGFSGEKDAGEMFFKEKQRYGFDFYSFHLFLRKIGKIKALALGDYTVNLGQGLIHWQGMGSGKGTDVLNIKKQRAVLTPYTSAGEYNFQRGAGITLYNGKLEGTAFFSYRNLDGTLSSSGNETVITSINTAGYHRTLAESEKKANTRQLTAGCNIKYKDSRWHVSFNAIHYAYSHKMKKKEEPYNLFALKGDQFTNMSADYSCTYNNFHFFGETALDDNFNTGFLNGVLLSIGNRIDASFVHRYISRRYQSLYGNAFTENTKPGNERGIYSGINIRLNKGISLAAYTDLYYFPWLKYRTDAPSYGSEYFLQTTYKPHKTAEMYIRYRYKIKDINDTEENTESAIVRSIAQQNLRLYISTDLSGGLTFRNRCELIWYDKAGVREENGYLWITDVLYKPMQSSWSANTRIAFFDTDGYNSRIYAYENDVLYASSISPLFSKGARYYINIRKKTTLKIGKEAKIFNIYLRWSQSIYASPGINSGLDEISGNKKSEIKLQLVIN